MANTFDLSKISVKSLPTKKITASFEDGDPKEYEISALSDAQQITLGSQLYQQNPDDFGGIRRIYACLLASGLNIPQNIAYALFDLRPQEAVRVGDEIFAFSQEYMKAKADEAAEAEKNSKGGTGSVA